MAPGTSITYLRSGRVKRGSGRIVGTGPRGAVKVKPDPLSWNHIWLTPAEVAAGKEKPPLPPQKKDPFGPVKPRGPRNPKPVPVPRWKELVERVRLYEVDNHPDGWPGVQMKFLTELADQLEAAQSLFKS